MASQEWQLYIAELLGRPRGPISPEPIPMPCRPYSAQLGFCLLLFMTYYAVYQVIDRHNPSLPHTKRASNESTRCPFKKTLAMVSCSKHNRTHKKVEPNQSKMDRKSSKMTPRRSKAFGPPKISKISNHQNQNRKKSKSQSHLKNISKTKSLSPIASKSASPKNKVKNMEMASLNRTKSKPQTPKNTKPYHSKHKKTENIMSVKPPQKMMKSKSENMVIKTKEITVKSKNFVSETTLKLNANKEKEKEKEKKKRTKSKNKQNRNNKRKTSETKKMNDLIPSTPNEIKRTVSSASITSTASTKSSSTDSISSNTKTKSSSTKSKIKSSKPLLMVNVASNGSAGERETEHKNRKKSRNKSKKSRKEKEPTAKSPVAKKQQHKSHRINGAHPSNMNGNHYHHHTERERRKSSEVKPQRPPLRIKRAMNKEHRERAATVPNTKRLIHSTANNVVTLTENTTAKTKKAMRLKPPFINNKNKEFFDDDIKKEEKATEKKKEVIVVNEVKEEKVSVSLYEDEDDEKLDPSAPAIFICGIKKEEEETTAATVADIANGVNEKEVIVVNEVKEENVLSVPLDDEDDEKLDSLAAANLIMNEEEQTTVATKEKEEKVLVSVSLNDDDEKLDPSAPAIFICGINKEEEETTVSTRADIANGVKEKVLSVSLDDDDEDDAKLDPLAPAYIPRSRSGSMDVSSLLQWLSSNTPSNINNNQLINNKLPMIPENDDIDFNPQIASNQHQTSLSPSISLQQMQRVMNINANATASHAPPATQLNQFNYLHIPQTPAAQANNYLYPQTNTCNIPTLPQSPTLLNVAHPPSVPLATEANNVPKLTQLPTLLNVTEGAIPGVQPDLYWYMEQVDHSVLLIPVQMNRLNTSQSTQHPP